MARGHSDVRVCAAAVQTELCIEVDFTCRGKCTVEPPFAERQFRRCFGMSYHGSLSLRMRWGRERIAAFVVRIGSSALEAQQQ